MTIKSSRAVAAAIALLGVIVLVMLYPASIATGQPALLWLGGIFAALILATLLFLLRVTSLTFDGTDLVYRVRGRETRIARDRVTSCALAGQWWVFSDASGTPILRLPTLQFSVAQVTAFSNRVGLRGFAQPLSPLERSRKDVKSAKSTRAFGVVITFTVLLIIAFSIWLTISAQDAFNRYHAAPTCEGASTASSCRLQTQARVTRTDEDRSSITLHISLIGSGGDYIASVNKAGAPSTGDVVSVEVWSGKVTKVGDSESLGNPDRNPNLNHYWILSAWLLFLVPAVAFAIAGHLQLRSARARLRVAAAA
jgi:hypothetical protein